MTSLLVHVFNFIKITKIYYLKIIKLVYLKFINRGVLNIIHDKYKISLNVFFFFKNTIK